MNFTDFFKLTPLIPQIESAIETVKKYMNDPEVPKAIALIEEIEKDPAVKAAIATAELVAKTLTQQGTVNEKGTTGTSSGGAIG